MARMRPPTFLLALALLGVAACGGDDEAAPPPWAKVAPEQIAEAKKHGVPVAFENEIGMRFVLIPAGTFMMGSPEDEEGRLEGETQHEVTITKPYYMQITEVTNSEYRRREPSHHIRPRVSPGIPDIVLDGDRQPVMFVEWEHAVAYAVWLSRRAPQRAYRLPTEAEWERACRAGTTTRFSWGDDVSAARSYANGYDPAATEAGIGHGKMALPYDDRYRMTAPVGAYQPNGWGLYDMHGNANEWCQDWDGEYPVQPVLDPVGTETPGFRVVRGGSFRATARWLRSAARFGLFPLHPPVPDGKLKVHWDQGFRLVSPLPESSK